MCANRTVLSRYVVSQSQSWSQIWSQKSVLWSQRHSETLSQVRHRSTVSQVLEDCEEHGTKEWRNAKKYMDVPGPKPLPVLGNSWRFLPYIGNFDISHIDQVSQWIYKEYGPIARISNILGRPDMVFLYDPDEIENVFRREDALPFRPSMPSLNYYKHVLRKDFFGDSGGVIAVHGQAWQEFRSKVQQVLLQPRIARQYIKPIEDTANAFIKRIELIKNEHSEVSDEFVNEIHKWSLESIAKVALDVRLGCLDTESDPETQKLIDSVCTFFKNVPELELKIPFWRIWSTPAWKTYVSSLDNITQISLKHVNKALENIDKNNIEEPSVLQRVLAMDNDAKTACFLALDLFLVGIDTTSTAVASTLYQLATHPEKQELLHEEISRILPETETSITHQKLEQMSYLKACIKETLRMYPVVIGNGRCTSKDSVILGYQIPKGVQIIFQHYAMGNMEKYFPKADTFMPERWTKNCPYAGSHSHHPFVSLPFGYGRRMCLGRRFADLEMQTVLAKIVQHYKVEYHYEKLEYHLSPMYIPNGPLKFKFVNRY